MSIMDRSLALDSLTPLHWLGIAMALVSALVHLVLGVGFFPHYMGVLFLLATGGFVGAVVLVLLDYRRTVVYLVGIPFTLSQIVGWYVVNQPDSVSALGAADIADKVAQVVLIAVLVVLYRRES
nr:hypothetical protein [Natranaeroarchaeum sulfidigenes]